MNVSQAFENTTTWTDRLGGTHTHTVLVNIKSVGVPYNYQYSQLLYVIRNAIRTAGAGTCTTVWYPKGDNASYCYDTLIVPTSIAIRATCYAGTGVIPEGTLKEVSVHATNIKIADDNGNRLTDTQIKNNINAAIVQALDYLKLSDTETIWYILTGAHIMVGGAIL